jgi:hypothetical protein
LKKTKTSGYFTHQGFVSIEALLETEGLNSAFFIDTIPPHLVEPVNLLCPTMQDQGYCLHIDNTQPHNSALSFHKTEELGLTRLLQPPYFPDLTPCDFFLFGYLKKALQWMNIRSQNGVISVVTAISSEIPVRTLSGRFG